MIGKTASKAISKAFNGSYDALVDSGSFDFTAIEDFGRTMSDSMVHWINNVPDIEKDIALELNFLEENFEPVQLEDNPFNGKTFCVTGKFNTMKRSEIEEIIVNHGGKLTGCVSKKTDFLLTNDADSGSSKAKAHELNIPVMDEETFKGLIQ